MPRFSAATAVLSATLLNRIRAHLRLGGIIAYPTESCYGLGCDPRNRRAVMKLLRIKRRPQHKGLILIGSAFTQLQPYAAPLTEAQWHRISPTWPGPVTWLLPATSKTPSWLRGRHQSIAVRVTAHPLAARLCQTLNVALVSSSANRSGQKPARTAAACAKLLGSDVLVVPGLIGKRKRPSTIIELGSEKTLRN